MKNGNVEKIREKYLPEEKTELECLQALDKRVSRPANVFAWEFGSISAIIMGAGMSLIMTDIGQTLGLSDTMTYGVIVGVIGMVMCLCNYPIYKSILKSRRNKYSSEILCACEKIEKTATTAE